MVCNLFRKKLLFVCKGLTPLDYFWLYITFKMSCSSPYTTKHPTFSADAFSCIVIFTRWCPHATLSIITQDTSGCRCFQQYAFCKRGRLCPQSCALIHAIEAPADSRAVTSSSDRKAARSRTHRKGWWVTPHLFHCARLHRLGTAAFLEQQFQHGCRFYRVGKKSSPS